MEVRSPPVLAPSHRLQESAVFIESSRARGDTSYTLYFSPATQGRPGGDLERKRSSTEDVACLVFSCQGSFRDAPPARPGSSPPPAILSAAKGG